MKKKILLATTLTAAALALTACGGSQPAKDQTAAPAPAETTIAETTKTVAPVIGSWKATKMVVTDGTDTSEMDIPTETSCKFNEDGTFTMVDNGQATSGTWTEAGDSVYLVKLPDDELTFTVDGSTIYYQFESPVNKGTFTRFVFEKE